MARYAFGAYAAATAIGLYFDRGWPVDGGYLVVAIAAIAIGLVMGYILERVFLRRVYGKDEVVVVLITYALFLNSGGRADPDLGHRRKIGVPALHRGRQLLGQQMPLSVYDIGLVGFAGLLRQLRPPWPSRGRRNSTALTAVIYDRETAAAFGVNVTRVYTVTFLVGAVLGALGGALTAPKYSVTPGLGVEVIVLAFAVVAIGGMGSMEGALIGTLIMSDCSAPAPCRSD